jgi:dihydrofolate reductase
MKKISLIAAVDENFGLGKDNQLLCHLPADLKHFKQTTHDKSIIMGRKTFLSIGKPLPNRQNIVLTRKPIELAGAQIADSFENALKLATLSDEIMIIGGESVYQEALPQANTIYLTVIHHQFIADVFFPFIDKALWVCSKSEWIQHDDKNRYDMTFFTYERK